MSMNEKRCYNLFREGFLTLIGKHKFARSLKLTAGLPLAERSKYGFDFFSTTIRQKRFHFVTEKDKRDALHNTIKSTI
jgi:hypothetical protein